MSCMNCTPKDGAIKLLKAMAGLGNVSILEQHRRQQLCRSCEHLIQSAVPAFARCGLCGANVLGVRVNCFVAAKTKLEAESCPANPPKWNAETVTENRPLKDG
jgi:hypothetical protein